MRYSVCVSGIDCPLLDTVDSLDISPVCHLLAQQERQSFDVFGVSFLIVHLEEGNIAGKEKSSLLCGLEYDGKPL